MPGPFSPGDFVVVYDEHGQAMVDEGVVTGSYPPVAGVYAYDVRGQLLRLHSEVPAYLLDHLNDRPDEEIAA
jgi:hypothetical protein